MFGRNNSNTQDNTTRSGSVQLSLVCLFSGPEPLTAIVLSHPVSLYFHLEFSFPQRGRNNRKTYTVQTNRQKSQQCHNSPTQDVYSDVCVCVCTHIHWASRQVTDHVIYHSQLPSNPSQYFYEISQSMICPSFNWFINLTIKMNVHNNAVWC